MYKTLGFKWLIQAFCPASAFVSADSDKARNPQRFIHANVGHHSPHQRNNRKDYLFGLKQEYESYKFFQQKIKDCDKEIEILVKQQIKRDPEKLRLKTTDKPHKRINKNAPEIKDFNQVAFRFFGGVDLWQ